jgi:hypothetical protein
MKRPEPRRSDLQTANVTASCEFAPQRAGIPAPLLAQACPPKQHLCLHHDEAERRVCRIADITGSRARGHVSLDETVLSDVEEADGRSSGGVTCGSRSVGAARRSWKT